MIRGDFQKRVDEKLAELGEEFPKLNWNFRPDPKGGRNDKISSWLGEPEEDAMLCVFLGRHLDEAFHRQDFFFINFAWQGDYDALSARYNNRITVHEGDCYIGQPYSGYALKCDGDKDIIIYGILIQKTPFYRDYLPMLAADPELYRFFLEPVKDRFSEEYLHLTFEEDSPIWPLLGVMALEYTSRDKYPNMNARMRRLVGSMMMYISDEYHRQCDLSEKMTPENRMLQYIRAHSESVTLSELAREFGYHPNYISKMLPQKTGKTFSGIVLETRMEKARLLLQNTSLTIEQIAQMLGFGSTSNFYKAFRSYYKTTPRRFLQENTENN